MNAVVEKILSPMTLEVSISSTRKVIKFSGLGLDKMDTSQIEFLTRLLLHQNVQLFFTGENTAQVYFEGLCINDLLLTRGYLLEATL